MQNVAYQTINGQVCFSTWSILCAPLHGQWVVRKLLLNAATLYTLNRKEVSSSFCLSVLMVATNVRCCCLTCRRPSTSNTRELLASRCDVLQHIGFGKKGGRCNGFVNKNCNFSAVLHGVLNREEYIERLLTIRGLRFSRNAYFPPVKYSFTTETGQVVQGADPSDFRCCQLAKSHQGNGHPLRLVHSATDRMRGQHGYQSHAILRRRRVVIGPHSLTLQKASTGHWLLLVPVVRGYS